MEKKAKSRCWCALTFGVSERTIIKKQTEEERSGKGRGTRRCLCQEAKGANVSREGRRHLCPALLRGRDSEMRFSTK